jgi:hypothetical protein
VAWTIEEIERDWLGGRGGVAITPGDSLPAVFARVEAALGHEYLETARGGPGNTGAAIVAAIVRRDRILRAVEGATGVSLLLDRLRRGDHSADAELTALYLCRPTGPIDIELAPGLNERQGARVADFRLRRDDGPWVYVEVTAPEFAETHRDAERVMHEIGGRLGELAKGTAAEVFLRRAPTPEEQRFIGDELVRLSINGAAHVRDLRGLGLLFLNQGPPGIIQLDDHGEPLTPRIGLIKAESSGEGPTKSIAVRYPYTDEDFLRKEARQLPKDAPGIVMISASRATGAARAWGPLLSRRLRPDQHTRVGAIGIFHGGIQPTSAGEAWVPEIVLVSNDLARHAVPDWLVERLKSFEGTTTE